MFSIEENGLGWVGTGMKLVTQSSGAEAINKFRLVTDENGSIRGCFIPDSSVVKILNLETELKHLD